MGPGGYLRRLGAVRRRPSRAPTPTSCSARGTTARPTPRRYRSARIDWGSDTGQSFRSEVMIPFLDQYLKDGPPAAIARVTAFQGGTNQWRRLADWPLACARACPAKLTPLYLAPGHRVSFDGARRARLRRLYFRPRAARHLSLAPQPLALGAGLDLGHLAGRRPALRRGPPRRRHLFVRAADRAAQARRHAARPPRRLDLGHRQRLGGQVDRRLSRPLSAKARARRLPAGDRDGRDARPLPRRSGACRSRSPPTSR